MTKPGDDSGGLVVRLARGPEDLRAAQHLRYRVFVEELGATGPTVDDAAKLEADRFDAHFEHLLLVDQGRDPSLGQHVLGVYRLLTSERMATAGRFYSEDEFDLAPLKSSGRRLAELGRSCIDPAVRGGSGMLLLWNGLTEFVLERGVEVLFGAASFHGTDPEPIRDALAYLHRHHLAPPEMRVTARGEGRLEMSGDKEVPAPTALAHIPALIRAYLRLGGHVGDGAFIDGNFNTIDVCLIMDTKAMSARHRAFHIRRAQGAGA